MLRKANSFHLSDGIGKMTSKVKAMFSVLSRNKTQAELATDYEIHPNSLLYRLCD